MVKKGVAALGLHRLGRHSKGSKRFLHQLVSLTLKNRRNHFNYADLQKGQPNLRVKRGPHAELYFNQKTVVASYLNLKSQLH